VYPDNVREKFDHQPVSRILSPLPGGYHLSCRQHYCGGLFCLPFPVHSCSERAAHLITRTKRMNKPGYTWHFSMQGLPAMTITRHDRGLLPHVFNFTRPSRRKNVGSNFLWPCLFPLSKDPALNRCIALRCPDFPLLRAIARLMVERQIYRFNTGRIPRWLHTRTGDRTG
jgi:hypothetical protein